MLRAKAEVMFTIEGRNYTGNSILRPAFKFSDGLSFSGDIISEHDEYFFNESYIVNIDFFTIEDEAFSALQSVLTKDMRLTIHEGRRILGFAKLLGYTYDATISERRAVG